MPTTTLPTITEATTALVALEVEEADMAERIRDLQAQARALMDRHDTLIHQAIPMARQTLIEACKG